MIRCITRWRVAQTPYRHGMPAYWQTPRFAPQSPRFHYATFAADNVHTQEADQGTGRVDGVFERIEYPKGSDGRNPEPWVALIEQGLPPHLRSQHVATSAPSLGAADMAEILLAAQRSESSNQQGIDVLYHLGLVQGRWNAVIWVVKQLVANLSPRTRLEGLSQMHSPWEHGRNLNDVTTKAIDLKFQPNRAPSAGVPFAAASTLDELTGGAQTKQAKADRRLRRDALGQVWRSLGAMVVACADEVIKPEILEIIAYLHHQEIMPKSIYSRKPDTDATAIQQPPTLHLLSSRILASLSDAAWRAHEKLVVEEARAKGAAYASLRPEIPGTAYRVRVPGLRPEVWLELILWACLHGGWHLEGAAILRSICRTHPERQWRPLSWRASMPTGEGGTLDWNMLDSLLNMRLSSTIDEAEGAVPNVRKTVSSEVVNAYVDVLLSDVDVGVGDRGLEPIYVLSVLINFRAFLLRSNLRLGGGSWDAVILRFVDSQGSNVAGPRILRKLEALSSRFGGELETDNINDLPSYVFDGSAAIVGLLHRALRVQVKAGNAEGALRAFRRLQDYTDSNKSQSLQHFFQSMRSAGGSTAANDGGMFSSNYKIEYPGFHSQVPTSILAPFMELVTDAKAHDVGRWLLYSQQVDGPLIPESLYDDPVLSPALVRFATATGDRKLLAKLVDLRSQQNKRSADGPTLPRNVLQSFLDAQIRLERWTAVQRILEYMRTTPDVYWNVTNLALIARMMLKHPDVTSEALHDDTEHVAGPRDIFVQMITGEYDHKQGPSKDYFRQIKTLLVVLSTINPQWADLCQQLQQSRAHFKFDLSTRAFNEIIGGVAETYGSTAARRLLELFWPAAVRDAQSRANELTADGTALRKLPPRYERALDEPNRQRSVLRLRNPRDPRGRVVLYGGLRPDLMTIRIIFSRALKEMTQRRTPTRKSSDGVTAALISELTGDIKETPALSPSEMVVWAVKSLRELGMEDEDIQKELGASLSEREMHDVRADLPMLFQEASVVDGGEEDTIGWDTSIHTVDGGADLPRPG